MPNYSKRRKPLKGALRLFDCEVFVYGMTYFPINPRYIDPNNVVTYKNGIILVVLPDLMFQRKCAIHQIREDF